MKRILHRTVIDKKLRMRRNLSTDIKIDKESTVNEYDRRISFFVHSSHVVPAFHLVSIVEKLSQSWEECTVGLFTPDIFIKRCLSIEVKFFLKLLKRFSSGFKFN